MQYQRLLAPIAAVVLLILLISGCGRTKPQLQSEWSTTLRELGIVPLFPPREDVLVGDVYAYTYNPESLKTERILTTPERKLTKQEIELKRQLGMNSRWTTLPLHQKVQKEYESRYVWPPTTPEALKQLQNKKTPIVLSVPAASSSVFSQKAPKPVAAPGKNGKSAPDNSMSRVSRLRLVGFPDFTTTSVHKGDLQALIPVEALTIGGIFSFDEVDSVSLHIPVGESYAVPIQDAIEQLCEEDPSRSTSTVTRFKLKSDVGKNIAFLAQNDGIEHLYIRVLTEVFYARTIDVRVTNKKSYGGRVNVKPIVPGTSSGTPADPPSTPPSNPIPDPGEVENAVNEADPQMLVANTDPSDPKKGPAEPKKDPAEPKKDPVEPKEPKTEPKPNDPKQNQTRPQTAEERVAELNERLRNQNLTTTPGGTVQFVGATDRSIGMRRVFERPVAIGFRGVTLKVDKSGAVVDVLVPQTSVPTFLQTVPYR